MIRFILKKIANEFSLIRFSAASLAFSTLFSMIPFLVLVLISLQSIGALEYYRGITESFIFDTLKEAAGNRVTKVLRQTTTNVDGKALGITGFLFLIAAVYTLLKDIDYAFQKIWDLHSQKRTIKRRTTFSLVVIFAPALVTLVAWLYSLKLVKYLQLPFYDIFNLFLISILVLWLFYKFIPNTKVSTRASLSAAVISSCFLGILQSSFSWFAKFTFKSNPIYGSIAFIPILMLWILLIWIIILSGASICAFLQQKIFKRT